MQTKKYLKRILFLSLVMAGAVAGEEMIRQTVDHDGVEVRLKAECVAFAKRGDRVAMTVSCEPAPEEVVGSHVLLAVGRRPKAANTSL